MIVGSGDYRYRVNADWAKLPDVWAGGNRQRQIVPAANALRIRSKASGETTHAPAAVGRNSRSAVSLRCGLDQSAPRWLFRMSPETGWSARAWPYPRDF
jgi:hypothetical protein